MICKNMMSVQLLCLKLIFISTEGSTPHPADDSRDVLNATDSKKLLDTLFSFLESVSVHPENSHDTLNDTNTESVTQPLIQLLAGINRVLIRSKVSRILIKGAALQHHYTQIRNLVSDCTSSLTDFY